MTTDQILEFIRKHPLAKVKLAVTDIDGILRGKYISAEKFSGVAEANVGFCDVVFGWDCGDVAYDNVKLTGWHTGYPDAAARLDLSTFRKIPWEQEVPFFLGEFIDHNSQPAFYCPRQLLKKIKNEAENEGYTAYFSQEFEWFNFRETPKTIEEKNYRNLMPLTPGMFGYSILRTTLENPFFTDLFELLRQFDVPLEGLHTETGPGVYEAAITYSDILQAADRAVLFKTSVKEIAYKHGCTSYVYG
jgi:glutamine synthetase